MKMYRLFLREDQRKERGVEYYCFVGNVWTNKDVYIKKVKLWDEFTKSYQESSVILKVVGKKGNILSVNVVEDGMI